MNRREFMKAAMATVAGVSVGGIGAVACPVVDEVPAKFIYTRPRFTAGEPIKAGVLLCIMADGRAYRWSNVKIQIANSRHMLRCNSYT